MNFLCPACRTPLPRLPQTNVLPCTQCGVEVDVSRIETSPGQSALKADVDLAGETLGPYLLTHRLGAGGMGVVYAAQRGNERFAVKVLGGLLSADPALRTRFRREAAALRAIQHPGVVRVVDEGEERGFCWYAMERVEGSDLRARIKEGPLEPAEVESLARMLLFALATVHEAGFVHRDVKPGNVLLTMDDEPKLCDFGIAHVDGAATLTESAAILGSLRYMAPEQRLGKSSARSDLYALGVTLHEALTGGSVPDETPLPSKTPRRLRKLVHALTQLRADERPASARAALRILDPSRAPRRAALGGVAGTIALALFLITTLRPKAAFVPPPELPGVVAVQAKAPPPKEPPVPTPAPAPIATIAKNAVARTDTPVEEAKVEPPSATTAAEPKAVAPQPSAPSSSSGFDTSPRLPTKDDLHADVLDAANALVTKGEYPSAIKQLEMMLADGPSGQTKCDGLRTLGWLQERVGSFDDSLATYRSFLQSCPRSKARSEVEKRAFELIAAERRAAAGKAKAAETKAVEDKAADATPELEPAKPAPRAKPLDFEGRLQELDAQDPEKGQSVRAKLETLDPVTAEARKPRKKLPPRAPTTRIPPRSDFKDDEAWLQAVDKLDARTGSLLRAKLAGASK